MLSEHWLTRESASQARRHSRVAAVPPFIGRALGAVEALGARAVAVLIVRLPVAVGKRLLSCSACLQVGSRLSLTLLEQF